MTFSIVGRSADGTQTGVAVASKYLACGAFVPGASADAGAVATQAYANVAWRREALALLRAGRTAPEALAELTAADPQVALRQAGLVGLTGPAATSTGEGCLPWAGGATGSDAGGAFAAQGNMLAGPAVVEAMAAAWRASDPAAPLARRLVGALAAGEAAGGDPRGRQSAAVLVVSPGGGYGGGSDVLVDLRSDDSPAPVDELARMLDLHDLYFGRCDPADLLPLEGETAAEVARLLAAVGHAPDARPPGAAAAPGTGAAAGEGAAGSPLDGPLWDWMGVENYEERFVPGAVDPVVLGKLREAAGTRAG